MAQVLGVRVIMCSLAGCLLLSCQPISEPVKKPKVDIPSAWKASGQSNSAAISTGWLKDLNDPQVVKLVNESMSKNPNLLATAERLEAAQQGLKSAFSNRLPSANVRAGASRSRTESGAAGGDVDYGSGRSFSFGASWEVDLWGRLKNIRQAALLDYEAAVADFRGTRLSLAARTASLWYNLISAENQVRLAEDTVARNRKVQQIIERNYKAGTVRAFSLQLARNNVFSAERNLRSRLGRRDDARRNIEILLGRYPEGVLKAPNALPTIRKDVPAGLPAGIIERRPDLVQARLRLEASFERAIIAKKNLLPSLRLSASSGSSPARFSDLLDPSFLSSSVSASLSQSLFEGGALRADAEAAVLRNKAQVHEYTRVALEALREVESALASEDWLKQQEFFLRKELEQASLAETQAERDYSQGVDGVDILDLLESQRRAESARSSLIDLQNQRIQNRINLHLALGGSL